MSEFEQLRVCWIIIHVCIKVVGVTEPVSQLILVETYLFEKLRQIASPTPHRTVWIHCEENTIIKRKVDQKCYKIDPIDIIHINLFEYFLRAHDL